MTKKLKIMIGFSLLGLAVSAVVSWLFGGYNPIVSVGPTIWTVPVLIVGIIFPLLILVINAIYGVVGLFQKDYKRFLIAVGISIIVYWLLQLFTFPPLFIK